MKEKILVVDDEKIARVTLTQILRLEGYTVHSVESGEMALEALRQESFDLVIVDLQMPGISGLDVLRNTVREFPGVRFIILTAYGSMDTAIEALRSHAYDYLLKPASPQQILDTVNRVLSEPARLWQTDKASSAATSVHTRPIAMELPGGAELNWNRRVIVWKNQTILLTPTELRLFEVLCETPGRVVSHSELIYRIQGYQLEAEEAARILRPVLSRLRNKLSIIPGGEEWIKTTRGAGYMIDTVLGDNN